MAQMTDTVHAGPALRSVRRTKVLTDIVLVVIVTILAYVVAILLEVHHAIRVGLDWDREVGADQLLVAFYVFAFAICWFAIRRLREWQELSTSLARTTTSLVRTESLYGTLFESISEGVVITSEDGVIMRANEACARMLGYERGSELMGSNWEGLFARAEDQQAVVEWSSGIGAGEEIQLSLKTRSDATIEVLVSSSTFVAPEDGMKRVCTVMRDITAARSIERQREVLANMERVVRMGELATSLSHELNQPLTGILSNAQAARRYLNSGDGVDVAKAVEAMDDIIDDDRRASEVISRMRTLLKKGEATLEPLNLNESVMEVIGLYSRELTSNGINVSISRYDGLPMVLGDRIQIQQVLLNLIMNSHQALLHVRGARSILISTSVKQDRVVVTVTDNAGGAADGETDRIFEPFYTTKEEGLGIGLSICRSLIEAHEGSMWAEEGQDGLWMRFSIPVIEEDE